MISDTSPLVSLAKAGGSPLLEELFGQVLITRVVEHELLEGEHEETPALREALDRGWLQVGAVEASRIPDIELLGAGETASTALARETGADLLLLDDRIARNAARGLGLAVGGTLYVILMAVDAELMKPREARGMVDRMMRRGFRLSAEAHGGFLRRLGV